MKPAPAGQPAHPAKNGTNQPCTQQRPSSNERLSERSASAHTGVAAQWAMGMPILEAVLRRHLQARQGMPRGRVVQLLHGARARMLCWAFLWGKLQRNAPAGAPGNAPRKRRTAAARRRRPREPARPFRGRRRGVAPAAAARPRRRPLAAAARPPRCPSPSPSPC